MSSHALIVTVSRDWLRGQLAAADSASCGRCASSDLLAEAVDPDHARTHALVVAIEEIVDRAVEDFVSGGTPDSVFLSWDQRVRSVDRFRANLRAHARRVAAEALAHGDDLPEASRAFSSPAP